MTNYLANLLTCAFVLATPLLSIYLFGVVERRYGDRIAAWFDRCLNEFYYRRLVVEEWLREKLS